MKKKIKYRLEYWGVRLVDVFFWLLPRSLALWLGKKIGLLFGAVLKKRAHLVLANLKHAFPTKSEKERHWIASQVWKNLGQTAIEFAQMPKLTKETYRQLISFEGEKNIEKAQSENKGVLFVTFHFSNWEIAGMGHQLHYGNLVAIARPMKNPLVEEWVQAKRRACGMDIIYHRQAVRASLRSLKQKKSIAILVDQNLYQGGVFVDFFGRPAATTPLPALLHLRTGAPVIVCYSFRDQDKFRVVYQPPLTFPPLGPSDDGLTLYTQIITKEIENVVRDHPEKWFWIHNRWKRTHEAPQTPSVAEVA